MIAIHNNNLGFTPRWIQYCESKGIHYKLVNCYDNDTIHQLKDCDALMWHHWQVNSKDIIKAKRLLLALDHAGKVVFPNFKTGWHFDDKVAQKYLLESLNLPLVPTYHFVDRADALEWAKNTDFPKVFKLAKGAGSANVNLVHNRKQAVSLINQAFSSGINVYDRLGVLKERWRKFVKVKDSFFNVIQSCYRIFNIPRYGKLLPKERFEVCFQDFIPDNDFDIRVIVIDEKAFAIKRLVRKNDFRASGSGDIVYEKHHFDEKLIQKSFEFAGSLKAQVVAFDYVFDTDQNPLIVEISYGYAIEVYDQCAGYWDKELNFYEGKFDSCEWMVDSVLKAISEK
ncbi:MAG: ATP-grasp domain-containing protein [Cecembia sp.]|mgnify:CR=1 FL=1